MSRNRCAAFNTDSNRHQRVCACRRGLLDSISRWGTRHRSQRLHTDRKAATRAASSPQTSERSSYLAVLLALLASDSPRMGLSGGLMLDNAVKAGRRFRPFQMSFNWQAASRPPASRPKMEKARPAPGQALPFGRWSGRGLRPVIRNIRRRRLLPPCLTLYAQQAAPSAIWCLRPAPASGISALLEMWPSG